MQIAGGTGITPMLQVIDAIVSDPEDNTQVYKLSLIWSIFLMLWAIQEVNFVQFLLLCGGYQLCQTSMCVVYKFV